MSDCCAVAARSKAKTKGWDRRWLRIGAGAVIAANSMMISLAINTGEMSTSSWRAVNLGLLAAAAIAGVLLAPPLIARAFAGVRRKRITTELLFLSGYAAALTQSTSALARGEGETYFEVASLLLVIYSVGSVINRAAKATALETLERWKPSRLVARVVGDGGTLRQARVDSIELGAVVRLSPGDVIPVDGQICAGSALVREAELTGEPIAHRRGVDDRVVAGTTIVDASIDVVVESTTSRLVDRIGVAIERARLQPSRIEQAADRVARWLFPIVVGVASITLVGWGLATDWTIGVSHALAVLLIACPCALGFAVPLVLWTSSARLARRGIELRSGPALEALANVDTIVLDKTGTLTLADASVTRFDVRAGDPQEIAALVVAASESSDHPFAKALSSLNIEAGDRSPPTRYRLDERRILAGRGVLATVWDTEHDIERTVAIGPAQELWPNAPHADELAIVIDDIHRATAVMGEELRPGARDVVTSLFQRGLELHLLSGDRGARVDAIEGQIGPSFQSVTSRATPLSKPAMIEALQDSGRRVLFVGDGVNDGAALAQADVGLAISSGTRFAIDAADGRLSDLSELDWAIGEAHRSLASARRLIGYAAAYNAIGVAFAAAGLMHPITAAILMATSSLAVTLRSIASPDESAKRSPKPPAARVAISASA